MSRLQKDPSEMCLMMTKICELRAEGSDIQRFLWIGPNHIDPRVDCLTSRFSLHHSLRLPSSSLAQEQPGCKIIKVEKKDLSELHKRWIRDLSELHKLGFCTQPPADQRPLLLLHPASLNCPLHWSCLGSSQLSLFLLWIMFGCFTSASRAFHINHLVCSCCTVASGHLLPLPRNQSQRADVWDQKKISDFHLSILKYLALSL